MLDVSVEIKLKVHGAGAKIVAVETAGKGDWET